MARNAADGHVFVADAGDVSHRGWDLNPEVGLDVGNNIFNSFTLVSPKSYQVTSRPSLREVKKIDTPTDPKCPTKAELERINN